MIEKTYKLDCPVKIALLSDFHCGDPGPILDSLLSAGPEIITITGDYLCGGCPEGDRLKINEDPSVAELFKGCIGIAPTFVSIGNHEFMLSEDDLEVIASTGVTLLDNRWVNYQGLAVGGLSSAYYTVYRNYRMAQKEKTLYPKLDRSIWHGKPVPDLSWLDSFERSGKYRLLLCHHPEYYPKYLRERKIDLIFSGHCHGGQWRYYSLIHKEWRGLIAPDQGFFPALTSSVHDDRLVISCGLTNPVFIPRINNPTEIVYCEPSA